jgi:hypothetical protein
MPIPMAAPIQHPARRPTPKRSQGCTSKRAIRFPLSFWTRDFPRWVASLTTPSVTILGKPQAWRAP